MLQARMVALGFDSLAGHHATARGFPLNVQMAGYLVVINGSCERNISHVRRLGQVGNVRVRVADGCDALIAGSIPMLATTA